MTSGVYQLTFASGDTYIGKSINIEERWKQHMNKFYKGTAAKPMQAAFNRCGDPTGQILVECHEDHIDVVEACLISRCIPTLNSDRPKDPFSDLDGPQIDYLFETFKHSARGLVALREQQEDAALAEQKALSKDISKLDREVHKLYEEIVELQDLNDQLLIYRSEEEIKADISNRIVILEKSNKDYYSRIKDQEKELNKLNKEAQSLFQQLEYERLPWWKKLFK